VNSVSVAPPKGLAYRQIRHLPPAIHGDAEVISTNSRWSPPPPRCAKGVNC